MGAASSCCTATVSCSVPGTTSRRSGATPMADAMAEIPMANLISNKMSINKDFDRLGAWDLYRLRPLYEGSTNATPRAAEYSARIRKEGVGAAVRARNEGFESR